MTVEQREGALARAVEVRAAQARVKTWIREGGAEGATRAAAIILAPPEVLGSIRIGVLLRAVRHLRVNHLLDALGVSPETYLARNPEYPPGRPVRGPLGVLTERQRIALVKRLITPEGRYDRLGPGAVSLDRKAREAVQRLEGLWED